MSIFNVLTYYYYDESGVCGMNVNGVDYYYRKNIFGDIIGLYDASGNLLCKYIYDAWGSHKVVDSNGNKITDENHIGNINPFRYRGYYYDVEFKLYYLNSRYYDPNVRRFISPDDVSYLDPQSVGGLNLYAYCNNNPVMSYDHNGTFWFTFLTTAIGAVVGGVVGAVNSLINGEKWWQGAISGTASGATAGFIIGITKGVGIKAASYASAAVYSISDEIVDYARGEKQLSSENIKRSIAEVIIDTGINGTINYFTNRVISKMIPTNSGWFIPKKFGSYFTKVYGQRMITQTFLGGVVDLIVNAIDFILSLFGL